MTGAPPAAPLNDEPLLNVTFTSIGELGEISFVSSVRRAWNGGARLLASAIVLCSGMWPYAKAVLLAIAWRSPAAWPRLLYWLDALGRLSLLDVFAVVLVVAGTDLDLLDGDLGTIEAPRVARLDRGRVVTEVRVRDHKAPAAA